MQQIYDQIRTGATGYYRQERGLFAVRGSEAVPFLNGMITNDVARLEDGAEMLAAFPNAQGRLIALVRVRRDGERFLFETEEATREKLFQNLFRFTFAGDFFVENLSDAFEFYTVFNYSPKSAPAGAVTFRGRGTTDIFVPKDEAGGFRQNLDASGAIDLSDELFEVLRIESGLPRFGVDMDETTIVPELGLADLISYNKGCYIGQEIIARIHFRGHVAKQLAGLELSDGAANADVPDASASAGPTSGTDLRGSELKSVDGKSAGRITSAAYSPKFEKTIALAYVRYDFLAEGTDLLAGELAAKVKNLPFVE